MNREWVTWENERKLRFFFNQCFKAHGWSYKFFYQSFGEIYMVWFLPNLFLFIVSWSNGFSHQVWRYIYISFQSGETSEDLIICILILLKLNKFCSWYFTTIWRVFLCYILSFKIIIIIIKRWLLSWKAPQTTNESTIIQIKHYDNKNKHLTPPNQGSLFYTYPK